MSKRKVGRLFGHNIFMCRENELKKGEYRIVLNEGKFAQIIDQNDNVLMRTSLLNLLDIVQDDGFHGDEVVKEASSSYDGVKSVTYKKPKLVSKTVTVSDVSKAIEVDLGDDEDGFSDITIVFDLNSNNNE